jgi:hypothetical protein
MALMESPAIILAVMMANALRRRGAPGAADSAGGDGAAVITAPFVVSPRTPAGKILHESLTDGAQLLLLGAMAIGLLSGEAGKAAMQPFSGDLFKGMLAFFLLDMGLLTARNLPTLRGISPWLVVYAVIAPLCHAGLALGLALSAGLPVGDTGLLMVLGASASYIAVPAVLRQAIPEARPSLYFGLSLGITFPLNLLLGIPMYLSVAQHFAA